MAVFIFLKARKTQIAFVYAVYNLSIGAWAACWVGMIFSVNPESGLFWARMLHVPASIIPACFFHFVISLTRVLNHKIQTILKYSSYIFAGVFILVSFHPQFVTGVSEHVGLKTFMDAGPLYFLFILFFTLFISTGFFILILGWLKTSGQEKTQIILILMAYVIGYIGGGQAFLPVYDIPLPRYAFYLVSLAHVIIFYAIFKHGFMETKVIIRRAALLITIYILLVLMVVPMLYLVRGNVVSFNLHSMSFSLLDVILVGFVFSTGPFLYAYFVRKAGYFHENTMASLTHELKSPLSIIESALDVLASEARQEAGNPKQKEYLEMIDRNSARLRKFVDDLLLVMKTGAGKTQLTMTEVDMLDLCDTVVANFQEAAQAKGNTLELKQPSKRENLPSSWTIQCDRSKIEQVLSNLISNAIKFTRAGTITIFLKKDDKAFIVEVSDTGSGIAPTIFPIYSTASTKVKPGKMPKALASVSRSLNCGWKRMTAKFTPSLMEWGREVDFGLRYRDDLFKSLHWIKMTSPLPVDAFCVHRERVG